MTINVRLVNEVGSQMKAWSRYTLVRNDIVIPILPKRVYQAGRPKKMPLHGIGDYVLPSRVQKENYFPHEMTFAMTVEKSQGQTMDHAILSLSARHASSCNFDYMSAYVALSRVKDKSNIRLLLTGLTKIQKISSMSYLTALEPSKATYAFFAGFDPTTDWKTVKWNATNALAAYLSL